MSDNGTEMPLAAAAPGSILAAALSDNGGALLLPAGTVLDAALLARLAQHGIARVVVRDANTVDDPSLQRQRLISRIDYLFRAAGDNIAMRDLQSQITSYRLGGTP